MAILTPNGRRLSLAASTLSPVSGLISVSPVGNKVGQVVIWMGALVTVTGMLVGIGLGSNSGTRYTGVRSDGRSVSSIVGVAGTLGVVAVGGGTVDVAEGSGVAVGKASVGVGEGTVGVAVGQVSVAVGGGTVGVNVGNAWLGKAATVGLTSDTRGDAAVGVATGLACGPHLASDRPNASKVQQMRERSQTGIIESGQGSSSFSGSSLFHKQGRGQHTADPTKCQIPGPGSDRF